MTSLQVEKNSQDGKVELKVHNSDQHLPVWTKDVDLHVVGRPAPRAEGRDKVTGRATYASDVRLPGLLYARVVRSPHPHARVVRVDTSRAESVPGVRAVITAANDLNPDWWKDGKLFDPVVRFIGDEVAAIAAESETAAEDALRLIDVEYEVLPFVTDLEAALEPDAPRVHAGGNLAEEPTIYTRGDVATGMREAEVVVERTYSTQTALHNSLEPHGSTASWQGEHLTLWDSTQSVFDVREQVAARLGLPQQQVRVIQHHMGGGFGAKQIAWKNTAIAALLSRRAGRPVQLMLKRDEENLASGNRNATQQRVRIGARRDGTLLAIDVQIDQQAGAYMVGGESADVPGMYQMLYRCPNVRTEQRVIYCNTGPAVAFRAPGYVEGAFALEQVMDELARELQMDPVELRRRNYTERDQPADKAYTSPAALREAYERVTSAFGWKDRELRRQHNGTRRRGYGFAAHCWIGGGGKPPGYSWVKLNGDGSADIVTGTQDIGTGTRTGLLQVAAEELGLPLDRVAVHLGDTSTGPYSPVSSGSATQATIGPAVRAAAADARRQLLDAAAALLEANAADLDVRDGRITVVATTRSIGVSDVMQQLSPHMILGEGQREENPPDKSIRTFGAQCVEVEVDTATGDVTVLRVAAAHDCGRIINPTLVESQVIGAVTQGLGFALTEERVVDHDLGLILNANLEEYKVPTVVDVPAIEHVPLDIPDIAANPTGAKGIGEPPLIPTAPAIANAIFDAIGVRICEAPISGQRLLEALQP
jgi:CO/xanthine dehydrogenase Mo-binding subunit